MFSLCGNLKIKRTFTGLLADIKFKYLLFIPNVYYTSNIHRLDVATSPILNVSNIFFRNAANLHKVKTHNLKAKRFT
jgi:hypothetical protein